MEWRWLKNHRYQPAGSSFVLLEEQHTTPQGLVGELPGQYSSVYVSIYPFELALAELEKCKFFPQIVLVELAFCYIFFYYFWDTDSGISGSGRVLVGL